MVSTALARQDVQAIFEQVKNWGRWGQDDQRGALNFIGATQRQRAAATVQDGLAVSCALPLNTVPSDDCPFSNTVTTFPSLSVNLSSR